MTIRSLFSCLTTAALLTGSGCAIFTTRPTQLMSDTSAAIKAAREAQADVHAPELYRQANDWWFQARQEYKFKRFDTAEEYALKAREFAEKAEYSSIQQGAERQDLGPQETFEDSTRPRTEEFEEPTPVPYNQMSPLGGPGAPSNSATPSPKQ